MKKKQIDRRDKAKVRAKAATQTPGPGDEHRAELAIYHILQSNPKKQGPGRHSVYNDEICIHVEKLAATGATDKQIAKSIGIGEKTFYEWKQRYPHFSHAVNKYRGLANMYVENALFRSALGYDYTEEQATPKGEVVEVRKHVTGSVNAQKFYLTNRIPERYKNKVEQTLQLGADVEQMVVAIKRREE